MTEVGEFRQTQLQRTELAWRRTLTGVIAVVGFGSIHLVTGRHVHLGLYMSALSLLAIVPITYRIHRLRSGDVSPATWEPVALLVGMLALAAGVTVLE